MKMKLVATLAFFLNVLCFATYYSVAKEALNRIDPLIFTYFEMMTLVPAALIILICSWRHITAAIFKRGVLLGSSLCLALFTIAIALKYTTATSVAFYPALNGFLAAVFAWMFLRQPVRKSTWFAGLSMVCLALTAIGAMTGLVQSGSPCVMRERPEARCELPPPCGGGAGALAVVTALAAG